MTTEFKKAANLAKKKEKPTGFQFLHEANVTSFGYHDREKTLISYSSTKRVPAGQGVGWFNKDGEGMVKIHLSAGQTKGVQQWWVGLSDDDDWGLDLQFHDDHEAALRFYLNTPAFIDWDWIKAHGFN